jgi:hypothetical protein
VIKWLYSINISFIDTANDDDDDDDDVDDDDDEDSEDSAGEILPDVKHPVTVHQNLTVGEVIQQAKQRQAESKHQVIDCLQSVNELLWSGYLI